MIDFISIIEVRYPQCKEILESHDFRYIDGGVFACSQCHIRCHFHSHSLKNYAEIFNKDSQYLDATFHPAFSGIGKAIFSLIDADGLNIIWPRVNDPMSCDEVIMRQVLK